MTQLPTDGNACKIHFMPVFQLHTPVTYLANATRQPQFQTTICIRFRLQPIQQYSAQLHRAEAYVILEESLREIREIHEVSA